MKKISFNKLIIFIFLFGCLFYARAQVAKVDLAISSADISFNPNGPILAGNTVEIKAKVKNLSNAYAAKNVTVSFYFGNTNPLKIFEATTSKIRPLEDWTFSYIYRLPDDLTSGNKLIKVVVDEKNSISETNESNNFASKTLAVRERQCDLSINRDSISLTPNYLVNGTKDNTITIKAGIKNIGIHPCEDAKVTFYFRGQQIYEQLISKVLSQQTVYVTYPYRLNETVTKGKYYDFSVLIDGEHLIKDINRNNNSAGKQLNVLIPPNQSTQSTSTTNTTQQTSTTNTTKSINPI